MKHKTTAFTLLLAILVFAAGIVFSLYFSSSQYKNTAGITLPQRTDSGTTIEEEIRQENDRLIRDIEINTENVKDLIGMLKRPQNYSYVSINKIYSGTEFMLTTSRGKVLKEKSKTVRYEGEIPQRHILFTNSNVYIWKNGSKYFQKLGKGEFVYDDAARVPTYEDIMKAEKIERAELISENGSLYISVDIANKATGNLESYYISADNGLLRKAVFTKDSSVVAQVFIENVEIDTVDAESFMLPDGSMAS